jgi:hypothetical protein
MSMVAVSSSWSHCFLLPTNGYLWPDHAADRELFDALSHADYETLAQVFAAGHGTSGPARNAELDGADGAKETLHRRPAVHDYIKTHMFMSEKRFVSYPT